MRGSVMLRHRHPVAACQLVPLGLVNVPVGHVGLDLTLGAAAAMRVFAALSACLGGQLRVLCKRPLLRRHAAAALGCDSPLLGRVHRREALIAGAAFLLFRHAPAPLGCLAVCADRPCMHPNTARAFLVHLERIDAGETSNNV